MRKYFRHRVCNNGGGFLIKKRDNALRKISYLFLTLAIFLICGRVSWPAEPGPLRLSLKNALGIFRSGNLRLLAERYQIEISKADLLTAGLWPNPQLSVNQTMMEFGNGGTGQFSGRLDFLIETAGKRGLRVESASAGVRAAEAQFLDVTRHLLAETKSAYYEVVLAQQHQNLASENIQRFEQILRINEIRFQKGDISEVDLMKTRLQILDFQNESVSARVELNSAKNHLKSVLDLSAGQELEAVDVFGPAPSLPPLEQLQEDASRRPDLLASREQVKQNETLLQSAKAQRIPDITAGIEYDSTAPDYRAGGGGGVSLSLPLFNRNQGEIGKAEMVLQASQAQFRKLSHEIALEVEEAYHNARENMMLTAIYENGMIQDARSTLKIAENSYQKGAGSLLDLLEAERTFKSINFNYSQALFNTRKGIIALEGAVGKDFLLDQSQ